MNKTILSTLIALFSLVSLQGAFSDRLSIKLRLAYLETVDESKAFSALGIDFASDAISVEDKWIPEFDITYVLTDNLLAEVVLTLPQDHTVRLAGVGKLGELTHLPPTFSLVYAFRNDSNFTPYVSAGVNVTWILDEDLSVAGVGLGLDEFSVGFAAGIGISYKLSDTWEADASVKYIQLSSAVKAGGSKLTTATLDPYLYSFGLTYNF